MNKLEAQQTGGFPMETDTLDFIQTAYTIMNALGFISGANTIISGCVQTGSNVSDGVVFYGGEILEFKGGAIQSNVRLFQENATREFENGAVKIVYKKRWMGFGSSGGNIQWSSFTRPKSTRDLSAFESRISKLEKYCKPFTHGGGVVLWMRPANEIPSGWKECVDWRDRFPVGVGTLPEFNALGKTGGSKTATLTAANHAPHTHAGSVYISPHDHNLPSSVVSIGGSASNALSNHNNIGHKTVNKTSSGGGGTHGLSIQSQGDAEPFPILNPFRTVYFIEPIPE